MLFGEGRKVRAAVAYAKATEGPAPSFVTAQIVRAPGPELHLQRCDVPTAACPHCPLTVSLAPPNYTTR